MSHCQSNNNKFYRHLSHSQADYVAQTSGQNMNPPNMYDVDICKTGRILTQYYTIQFQYTRTCHNHNASYESYDAPDWVSEILAGDAHRGSSHTDDHGHFVVKLECPVVYVGLLEIEVVGEIREEVSHDVFCTFSQSEFFLL